MAWMTPVVRTPLGVRRLIPGTPPRMRGNRGGQRNTSNHSIATSEMGLRPAGKAEDLPQLICQCLINSDTVQVNGELRERSFDFPRVS